MSGVWPYVRDSFWDSRLWLPEGYSWDDFKSDSRNVYYPRAEDINWSIAVGVFLLLFRYLYERLVTTPIAKSLGVKERRVDLTPNPVLEKAYKETKGKTTHADLGLLAKKTELSERQIERWFLKRKRKDAPSSMTKFREVSWHFVFYLCSFIYGMYILWHREWFWDIKHTVIGWPKQHVDGAVYLFYLVELGFYWSLLISSLNDVRRSDFLEQLMHHVLTISLIYLSWAMNYVRYGCIILVLHDAADSWLAAGKMAKYSKRDTISEYFFVGFIVVWLITRMGLYPFWVIRFILFGMHEYCPVTGYTHKLFVGLLCGLQVLHVFWTYLILKIIVQKFTQGDLVDVRSDSESDDELTKDDSIQNPKSNGISGRKQ